LPSYDGGYRLALAGPKKLARAILDEDSPA
jgi:hypothetical protein